MRLMFCIMKVVSLIPTWGSKIVFLRFELKECPIVIHEQHDCMHAIVHVEVCNSVTRAFTTNSITFASEY